MPASANLNLMKKSARKVGRQLVKGLPRGREPSGLHQGPRRLRDPRRPRGRARAARGTSWARARPTASWARRPARRKARIRPGGGSWTPLDGTTNFLHGLPHWAVSIALEHKGEIVAGVIFDPAKDEMFWAEKGRRRVDEREPDARVRPFAHERGGVRHGHEHGRDATAWPRCSRTSPGSGPATAGGAALGGLGARPRLCRGGAVRRLLGPRRPALGHRGGPCPGGARRAGFAGGIAAGANPLGKGGIVAANASLHEGLGRLVRGD